MFLQAVDQCLDFAPCGHMPVAGKTQYEVQVSVPGHTGWHHATYCRSAVMAWTCQNFIRRTRFGMGVKVIPTRE